jgi:hypothetical protein
VDNAMRGVTSWCNCGAGAAGSERQDCRHCALWCQGQGRHNRWLTTRTGMWTRRTSHWRKVMTQLVLRS